MAAPALQTVTMTGRNGARVQFDDGDLRAAIRFMERNTRYRLPSILFKSAMIWSERAERLTKLAPQTVKTRWRYIKAAKKYVKAKEEKVVALKHRGYARLSWKIARVKLGKQTNYDSSLWAGGYVRHRGHGTNKSKRQVLPFVEVASTIPYIDVLDRKDQIATKATHNTYVKLVQMLERHAQRMMA